jgi:hypothetical protein
MQARFTCGVGPYKQFWTWGVTYPLFPPFSFFAPFPKRQRVKGRDGGLEGVNSPF